MMNVSTANAYQTDQGIWLFLKNTNQSNMDGISKPSQTEIEARLNAFFAAFDAKQQKHAKNPGAW